PPAKSLNGFQGKGDPACDDVNGPWALGGMGGYGNGLLSGGNGGSEPYGYPWGGFKGQDDPDNPTVVGGGGGSQEWSGDGQPGSSGKAGVGGYPGLGDVNSVALFYSALAGQAGGAGTRGAGG